MKLLGEVWGGAGSPGSLLAWVITALGVLSRVYPAEVISDEL